MKRITEQTGWLYNDVMDKRKGLSKSPNWRLQIEQNVWKICETMENAERSFENLLKQFPKYFFGIPKLQTKANS